MPIGAFKLNAIAKFQVSAAAQVIRLKKGISALGNAQISTAQSKFGGSSVVFDGTGDYLDSNSTIVTFGTGDFTIEGWARASTTLANNGIFHLSPVGLSTSGPAAVDRGLALAFYNTSTFGWVAYAGDSVWGTGFGTAHSANTWYHFALVRSGTTVKAYINGSALLTVTDATNYTAHRVIIGGYYSTSFLMNGYVDEFRISNTARYTSNFTPSTTPFVNDDNTLMLLHMDGTNASTYFEDDNGIRSQTSCIALGNAQISTAQSKFGGTSALFDGTDDYVQVYSDAFAFGTGDFTIECWARVTSAKNQGIFHLGNSYLPSGAGVAAAIRTDVGNLGWVLYSGGTSTGFSPTPALNTWYHIAIVRSSGTTSYYVNGTSVVSRADATNYSASTYLAVGGYYSTGFLMVGNIDELRVSNTARYTTSFTPSTTPFVNDTNTKLLMHMDGTNASSVFRDDNGTGRSQVALLPNSSAQLSSAASKFGVTSALFNRTAPNDWVRTDDSSIFAVENYSSWTLEFWLRFVNSQSDNFPISTSDDKFNMRIQSGGSCNFNTQGSSIFWTKTHTIGTWYHYAIVKTSDGTVTVYLDGVSQGTGTVGGVTPSTRRFYIGDRWDTGYCMDGYIDEVRISNTARYTANFTSPTAAFQNDSNTILLMHMDGTNGSTVFIDDNGKTPV